MAKSLFGDIYKSLKEQIESGHFAHGDLLPSEQQLVTRFGCSRMTIRKAISLLANEGLVLPINGLGVRVIWSPDTQSDREKAFTVSGLSSFTESAHSIGAKPNSKVFEFSHIICDSNIQAVTGFASDAELIKLSLVRYLDGKPVAIDRHYLSADAAPGITPEIAQKSIFKYIEQDLGKTISVSKRFVTVEQADQIDLELLELDSSTYFAVMRSRTYDSTGQQFEYVESKYLPSIFHFYDTATRTPLP